jgi:hypothetical protein
VTYEEAYLKAYGTVSEARAEIGRYLCFYNEKRPLSSRATPFFHDAPHRHLKTITRQTIRLLLANRCSG